MYAIRNSLRNQLKLLVNNLDIPLEQILKEMLALNSIKKIIVVKILTLFLQPILNALELKRIFLNAKDHILMFNALILRM